MAEDKWLRIIRKDGYEEFTEYVIISTIRAQLHGEDLPEDVRLMQITIELVERYRSTFDAMPEAERPLCLLCDKPFGGPPGALALTFPSSGLPPADAEISVPIYGVCDHCSLPADSMPGRVIAKFGCAATLVHELHTKVQ